MSHPFSPAIKKLLITLLLITETVNLAAAPGDTTWVTVFNTLKLTHHGNYDTTVAFPVGKRYRKIRMHYILGRYACAPGSQYCGSWDYTTQIFALPKAKDTVEVARVITPYATNWLQLNKSHDYIMDVTDYSSVLEDSTHMRFRYDGYSWGFTLTLRMEFIEGVPPMDAASVENVYNGYFAYGNAANPIENHLSQKPLTYTTSLAYLKNSISGHGADNTGCSEFCNKYYQLHINNNQVAQKQIWRDDCGSNQVYPQTGTWVFDRSNWCPGAVVWPIYHSLEGITNASTTFTADINMQPYTNSNPSGGFNFVTQLVSYSYYNHLVDVSIEDIVSPSPDPNYFRNNPNCNNPVIRIRNTGFDPLISVAFEYGLTGYEPATYTLWTMMNPLETKEVVLPPSPASMGHSVAAQFEVRVVAVNGMPGDDNTFNNIYYSTTKPVSITPKDFIVMMGTNASLDPNTGKSETRWQLFDGNDSLVAQRTNATKNTVYNDTILGLPDGCYRFVITDAGCDGYDWWYYQYYNVDPGDGFLRIEKTTQNTPVFLFDGDIGCGYTKYFHVGNYPDPPNLASLQDVDIGNLVQLYPNPASGNVLLKLNLTRRSSASYTIRDINGRIVAQQELGKVDLHYQKVNLDGFAAGVYFVHLQVDDQGAVVKKLIVH